MSRWGDPDDEPWDDDPDEGGLDDDDDGATVPCPHCRRPVYEDAERCPHCERYLSREDAPARPKPWWILLGVAACLYVVYRWITWR